MITKIANEFLKEAAVPGLTGFLSYIPGLGNIAKANQFRRLGNMAGQVKNIKVNGATMSQEARQAADASLKNIAGDSQFLNNRLARFNNMGAERLGNLQNQYSGGMWKNYAIGASKLGLTGGALWGGNKLLFGGNPAPAAPQMQRAAY